MIASTTVSATHIIASTTASTSDILVTLKLENKDIFSAIAALLTALTGIVGTFFAARYAFKLQDEANKRKEIKERIAAGNKTMFAIFRQCNELDNIQQQIINPEISKPERFISIRPIPPLHNEHLKYDYDNLNFLFETEYRDCMADLYLIETKFQTVAWLVKKRSDFHSQTVQPLLATAGFRDSGSLEDITRILGYPITTELTNYTNAMIEHIDDTIKSLEQTRDKLHTVLKKLYPNEKVMTFKSKLEQNQSPTPSP